MAETIQEQKAHRIDRLIRCRKTRRYFRDGDWTDEPAKASVYNDEIEAALACVVHNLCDIDLVLRAPGTRVDLFATKLR